MNSQINKKLGQDLFSANPETVISAINRIKEVGNKFYIPLFFDLLNTRPEPEIEREIMALLSTVKEKDTVNTFMRAVEDEKYKPIRKSILTACWQNGLDFSTLLPVFINLIISEPWEVAFEAFTIVDNLEHFPGEAIINTSIQKIEAALPAADGQKQYFLNEILLKLKA